MLDSGYNSQNQNFNPPPPYHHSHPPSRRKKKRFFFWLIIIAIILGLAFLGSMALAYKFYSTSKKVIQNDSPHSFFQSLRDISSGNMKPLRGEKDGRINILLLGLAGENYPGENLTDSIIIASINPKTYQTAFLSIPRDLYVRIPETDSYTKINALYPRGKDQHGDTAEGVSDLKSSLEEITGLPIHYYIAIDFDGFKNIINQLGGISTVVPKDLHDERYPGPNYSYQTFDIKKGLQNLDGETALKYARTRHDEEGDFGRAYRQQQILESFRQKAFSIGTLVNVPAISGIIDTLGNHLRTDMPLDEIDSFLNLSKKIDTHTTTNEVLDSRSTESLLSVSHVMLGGVRAFILVPRTGNYSEIQERAKNIFNLDLEKRKQSERENEEAVVTIINASVTRGSENKISTLLQKLGYKTSISSAKNSIGLMASETTVYDASSGNKPFSLEELSQKLQAKVMPDLPASLSASCQKTDLCLVIGDDLSQIMDYEENSQADLEAGYDKQQIDERTYIDLLKKGSSVKFTR
jgi:polyisoprenyl-teichoic acid--peptidoglycan teichoic acid transferase